MAVWAALSTSGMSGLRLPDQAGALIVAVDADPAGQSAGHKLAERATALGWTVTLLLPPAGAGDWNDILRNRKGAAA